MTSDDGAPATRMLRIPAWALWALTGVLFLLGTAAGTTIFVCLIWVALLTSTVSNQRNEQRRLRGSVDEAVKKSEENQTRLDRALQELEAIRRTVKAPEAMP